MNKHQRAEINKTLLALIESGVKDLRLERLNATLARIDADNFGKCFKCDREIQFAILKTNPEQILCDNCLDAEKD